MPSDQDSQGSARATRSVPRADDLNAAVSTRGGGLPPLPAFHRDDLIAGRFKIVRLIGQGGMGAVYEAEDQELGGRVALKRCTRATSTRAPSSGSQRFTSPGR
jgi:hypothetical protein